MTRKVAHGEWCDGGGTVLRGGVPVVLEWVQFEHPGNRADHEVVTLIADFLGAAGSAHSVVSRSLPVFEQ